MFSRVKIIVTHLRAYCTFAFTRLLNSTMNPPNVTFYSIFFNMICEFGRILITFIKTSVRRFIIKTKVRDMFIKTSLMANY